MRDWWLGGNVLLDVWDWALWNALERRVAEAQVQREVRSRS